MIRHGSYRITNTSFRDFTPTTDFLFEAAKGQVNGFTAHSMWGKAVTQANLSVCLWSSESAFTQYDLGHVFLTVSSDSEFDIPSDSGAHSVRIKGYDANFNYQEEVVELDGTNGVNTVQRYIRVLEMLVESSGGSKTNTGKITAVWAGRKYATINAYEGKSYQAYTLIMPDKAVLLTSVNIGVSQIASCPTIVALTVKNPFDNGPINMWEHQTDTTCSIRFSSPLILPAVSTPMDMFFTIKTPLTSVTSPSTISITAEYLLVDQPAA